jgi:hypothetical protein
MKFIGRTNNLSLEFERDLLLKRIWLSMKVLLNEKTNIQKLSFWGKIFGIKNDYYIVEAGFDTFDEFDLNDSEFIKYQETFSTDEEDEIDNNINQKAPPDPVGNGVNQKIFFVSIGSKNIFENLIDWNFS